MRPVVCLSIRNTVFPEQEQCENKGGPGTLPERFRSEDRLRILRDVAERENVTVQTVAKATRVSKPVVSRYMHLACQERSV